MNWAYLHLAINHFPIIGTIIGLLLLIIGFVTKHKGVEVSGLGTLVFSAIMAVAAFLTGNPAEKVVENIPDVAKSLVSRHEDIASVGMYLLIPTGIFAALTLYSIWKKEKSVKFLVIITLILSLISSIAMVFVGRTGGQIRHSEFHDESVKQYIIQHKNDVEEDED